VITGDQRYDALASGVIGIVLIYVAYQLAWGARGLIVGQAPPERVRAALEATIASEPYIDRIVELVAVQIGTDQLLVMARVSVHDEIPAGEVERLMARLRARLRAEHPEVTDSFIELAPASS
jgi:divalent metal cation (Fe/Co/Zn/Cd) transporter